MIALFKEAGFTDEKIEEHFKQKQKLERERTERIKKQNEKPKARIFKGLNTNAM